MKKHIALLSAFLLALQLSAQPIRNHIEKSQDRHQIATDKAIIDRDRAELAQFQAHKNALKTAVANGDVALAHGHQQKIIADMRQEIQQSEAKTAAAAKEVQQSKTELRSDNREIHRDRAQARPVAAQGDRMDRRDDRRDMADDQSDFAERAHRLDRQREILADYEGINVQNGGLAAITEKLSLLDEFEQTMLRDMNENVEEIREDKGELREDRHETREDRRNR